MKRTEAATATAEQRFHHIWQSWRSHCEMFQFCLCVPMCAAASVRALRCCYCNWMKKVNFYEWKWQRRIIHSIEFDFAVATPNMSLVPDLLAMTLISVFSTSSSSSPSFRFVFTSFHFICKCININTPSTHTHSCVHLLILNCHATFANAEWRGTHLSDCFIHILFSHYAFTNLKFSLSLNSILHAKRRRANSMWMDASTAFSFAFVSMGYSRDRVWNV